MYEKEISKLAAVKEAVRMIHDGDVIGVGSGSTVKYFIRELARRIVSERLEISCVPSSIDTKIMLTAAGLEIADLYESMPRIGFDGADQITREGWMIKGGGGAMTRERIVAHATKKWVIMVDHSKLVKKLSRAVPVEILPFAYPVVKREIEELGGKLTLRDSKGKLGPVISDNGNILGDAEFGEIENPEKLYHSLNALPGVVDHGLFQGCSVIIIGRPDNTTQVLKPKFDKR